MILLLFSLLLSLFTITCSEQFETCSLFFNKMNEFEKRKCLDLTNKMLRKDLCRLFREKVDPERDGAPDYYTIIKQPMDLTTIRKKLNSNEYKSIEQWIDDMNLIWKNAKLYNTEGSIIHFIAQELEQWFARKCAQIPRNKDEEWMLQLRKSSTALMRLASHPPSSIVPMPNLSIEEILDETNLGFSTQITQQPSNKTTKSKSKTANTSKEQKTTTKTNENDDDVQIIEQNQQETPIPDERSDSPDDGYGDISDERSAGGTDESIDL